MSILLVDQVLALEHECVVAAEDVIDERVFGAVHALEVVIPGPAMESQWRLYRQKGHGPRYQHIKNKN